MNSAHFRFSETLHDDARPIPLRSIVARSEPCSVSRALRAPVSLKGHPSHPRSPPCQVLKTASPGLMALLAYLTAAPDPQRATVRSPGTLQDQRCGAEAECGILKGRLMAAQDQPIITQASGPPLAHREVPLATRPSPKPQTRGQLGQARNLSATGTTHPLLTSVLPR